MTGMLIASRLILVLDDGDIPGIKMVSTTLGAAHTHTHVFLFVFFFSVCILKNHNNNKVT